MEAILHLQQAERIAPESLRYNTIAREQIRELMRRSRRPSPAPTRLADRAGGAGVSGVLYMVVCGAPLAERIGDGVQEAKARGWSPVVIPTDAARQWIDETALGDVPVVTNHRSPHEAKRIPPADAVAVVPMTFNTLTAWANGTANTYPLTVLCAALGAKTPAVAVPFAKHDLAGHPAWFASMAVLRYAGVRLVDPQTGALGAIDPLVSGSGNRVANTFRWSWVLKLLE